MKITKDDGGGEEKTVLEPDGCNGLSQEDVELGRLKCTQERNHCRLKISDL